MNKIPRRLAKGHFFRASGVAGGCKRVGRQDLCSCLSKGGRSGGGFVYLFSLLSPVNALEGLATGRVLC